MKFTTVGRSLALLALASALCAFPDAVRAEDGPMDRIDKALLSIQHRISNANKKIRREMSGLSSQPRTGLRFGSEYVESCCAQNVITMRQQIKVIYRAAKELETYFSRQRDREALAELQLLAGNMGEVAQGVGAFQAARDRAEAYGALQGLIRPFNAARSSIQDLRACCAPAEEQPTPDGKP